MYNKSSCASCTKEKDGNYMEKDLAIALRTLKQKTGIAVDAYSSSFTHIYSSGEKIPFEFDGSYTDGLQDKKQNATLFRFRFKKETYYGVISGAGEVERNYAMFICAHLENSGVQDDTLSKADFLRSIVFGDCSSMQIVKYMRKFAVPPVPCYVLLITAKTNSAQDIVEFLESYTINDLDSATAISEDSCVFVKYITSEADSEFLSPVEYAELCCRSLFEETGIRAKIGVGCTVRSLSESMQSYTQAESALKTSEVLQSKSNVHSYKEYMLYKMIEDLPPATLISYYNVLVDGDAKSIFADPDMLGTAEKFLENNLNVSETARKLYMHRNTLTYRLDKIQRATGLDIRNFSDAITFRLCSLLYKISNKQVSL